MLSKTLTCLVILFAMTALMSPLYAQRAGQLTAVAVPAPTGFSNGVTPHIAPPIITTSYSQIYSQFPPDHQPRAVVIPSVPQIYCGLGCGHNSNGLDMYGHVYSSAFGTVIIPATIITNSAVIVQQPLVPAVAVGVVAPVIPARGPHPNAPTPAPHGPAVGTPRQQVIQQYGNPVTTMYSLNGETLYFAGGTTVFLQNGQVATQRPN